MPEGVFFFFCFRGERGFAVHNRNFAVKTNKNPLAPKVRHTRLVWSRHVFWLDYISPEYERGLDQRRLICRRSVPKRYDWVYQVYCIYIAIALPGFNDLGRSVTPISLLMDHFLWRVSTFNEKMKIYRLEV